MIIRIGAYTFAGFILSCLIAWVAPILHSSRLTQQYTHTIIIDPTLPKDLFDRMIGYFSESFGITSAIVIEPDAEDQRSLVTLVFDCSTSNHPPVEISHLPSWVRRHAPSPTGTVYMSSVRTQAAGFPFRMLTTVAASYEFRSMSRAAPPEAFHTNMSCPIRHETAQRARSWVPANRTVTWGGLQTTPVNSWLTRWTNNRLKLPTHLPLTPIWPALLANTAIYTTLIWFTCWLLATTRRRIHRWRHPNANPCRHCLYDLTGITQTVCPECGHPIPHSA